MIALLLACAPTATEAPTEATPPFVPSAGVWTIGWAESYGGDCQLADMATRQPASIDWTIELESQGFTLRDEYAFPMGCDLLDRTFACSLGTYHIPWDDSGLEATEYITTVLGGDFSDAASFTADYTIHAECAGSDCAEVGTQYGADFVYPCSAVAGLTGTWQDG